MIQPKAVAADLKKIYQAVSLQEAETHLEAFAQTWDGEFSTISKAWRERTSRLATLHDLDKVKSLLEVPKKKNNTTRTLNTFSM